MHINQEQRIIPECVKRFTTVFWSSIAEKFWVEMQARAMQIPTTWWNVLSIFTSHYIITQHQLELLIPKHILVIPRISSAGYSNQRTPLVHTLWVLFLYHVLAWILELSLQVWRYLWVDLQVVHCWMLTIYITYVSESLC